MQPLAIIAFAGQMPELLIQACTNRAIFIIAHYGYTPPALVTVNDHIWLYLGELGKAMTALAERGIQEVVMAGHLPRPSLRHLKPDKEGLRLLSRLGLRWSGDNHMLMTIQRFLEEEGFILKSPQDIMPTLLAQKGALGQASPSSEALADIHEGITILEYLSPLDFGQGIAIQNGLILAIEAAEGTDQCIARSAALARQGEPSPIYIKRAKVHQSEKIDLPTIGVDTMEALIKAEFQGLAFQTQKTLILFPDQVKALADQAGLFLWGAN